ncbi:DUF4911 domain-containing protein [Maridesulfovibrio sp.]|uniref:DUF4911 domain-containing protein n=1 Tax=Maridesulfovibrio sp. TaxID=2795000 RepID=UPI002A18CAE4|nr:DUF4911 domain-containing protein [Maridesulfovibrio sp.]
MARKRRPRPCPPPPAQSGRTYVQIKPSDIAMFRFLLEAEDNLALFTIADRFRGVLLLRYSPHQEREFREFMAGLGKEMDIVFLPDPAVSA